VKAIKEDLRRIILSTSQIIYNLFSISIDKEEYRKKNLLCDYSTKEV